MIGTLVWPDRRGRLACLLAGAVWTGALVPRRLATVVGMCLAVVVIDRFCGRTAAAIVGLAVLAGMTAVVVWAPTTWVDGELPVGPVAIRGIAATDARGGLSGPWVVVDVGEVEGDTWDGPPVLVRGDVPESVRIGDVLEVAGTASAAGGSIGGRHYGWRIRSRSTQVVGRHADAVIETAALIRDRVLRSVEGRNELAAPLVSGFLIGEVGRLARVDEAAMRDAGLTHYVAVSGSNVALFLGGLWLLAWPFSIGGRHRAIIGLTGLLVFAAVTRWEPSVLRASVMAALVLAARAFDIDLGGWTALGMAVALVLMMDPAQASHLGFQLSVAATAGVMAGHRLITRAGFVGPALSAALAAQVAVAPLLLWRFGSIPVVSPLVNVVAAPLVAASTATGAVGALLGIGPITGVAVHVAGVVLHLAHLSAGWPRLGAWGLAAAAGGVLAWRVPTLRLVVVIGIASVVMAAAPDTAPLAPGEVVFLDVGQGDSTLIRTTGGAVILVDGGPDDVRLLDALRTYGVSAIDVVVISHAHADHIRGLEALPGRVPVGTIWYPPGPGTPDLDRFVQRAAATGAALAVPSPNSHHRIGGDLVAVHGPTRRYGGLNDGSLVLTVRMGQVDVVLAGDVEEVAMLDLVDVRGDVLKVPHHGSATSDPEWLADVGARVAVISVGPNTFGHPDAGVVAALEQAGAAVLRTDEAGDVRMRLAAPGPSTGGVTIGP